MCRIQEFYLPELTRLQVELSKTGGKLPIAAAKPMSLSSSRSNPGQRPISNGSAVVSSSPLGYPTTSPIPFPVTPIQPVARNGTSRDDMVTDRDAAASRKRKQSDASIDNQPVPPPPSITTTIAGPSASIPPRMPPPKRKKKEADPFMPVKVRYPALESSSRCLILSFSTAALITLGNANDYNRLKLSPIHRILHHPMFRRVICIHLIIAHNVA